jgi:site-specific recombinase XerD
MTWVEVFPIIVVDVVISCCPARKREGSMRVQRVFMPGPEAESWTLLGDDQVPLEPVERFLAYLTSIEKSPNTLKAYAHDLKDWFTYLTSHGLDWQVVTIEDVAGFVAWLRLPPGGRDGKVAVLSTVEHHCSESSVNRKLAALTSFCEFHARHGVALAGLLTTMQPAGRRGSATSYKPFLHHITTSGPQRRRAIKLKMSRPRPKVLTAAEAQTVLDACDHLRDRLLFALLLDCGVRIGEALGLRHEDMGIAERAVTITPRSNDNRARAKAGISRAIPASAELMRLYADYLTREYGSLDSDYVFVNLWSQPYGRPWTYAAVYDLVLRLRERTGIDFEPHQYRHTYATWLLRRGAGMETVKQCLGHASITTTIDTYGHLTVEDARKTLEAAGWFTGREVQL